MRTSEIYPDPLLLPWYCRNNNIKSVAFVSGCFDVLHVGHRELFEFAKNISNRNPALTTVVVGLNSDKSIRELKGPSRPINNERARCAMVDAMRFVDAVCIIKDTTMTDAIAVIRPDYWIKGAEYTLETLNQDERRMAESIGTKILFAPKIEGYSTTSILAKI